MLITVETDTAQQDTTRQQFSQRGRVLFLPLFGQWASLVWYDSPQRIRQLQAADGTVEPGNCQGFPITVGGC